LPRNFRPIEVLNSSVDARKPTAGSQPLWLIVFLLAVIATCLVMLVVQQRLMFRHERVKVVPPSEIKLGNGEGKHVPAIARPAPERVPDRDRDARKEQHTSTRIRNESASRNFEPVASPQIIPVVAREPEPVVPIAIAPLAIAPTNVTPQTNALQTGIFGRVTLKGTPPKETSLSHEDVCGRTHLKVITTRHYEVSRDGGLANVFVRIKSGFKKGQKFDAPPPVVLDQVDCLFQPYVLGLMGRQMLVVTNSDPILHNVDAQTGTTTLINRTEKRHGQIYWQFDADEDPNLGILDLIRVRCDLHSWMTAYICAVSNPFFAVTDSEGNYAITNVPPGEYEIEAFHVYTHKGSEDLDVLKTRVSKDQMTEADFVIKAKSR
jgi:hypothetical protein